MYLQGIKKQFATLLENVAAYWGRRLPRDEGEACVIVEALHQDVRVVMRNLLLANALRCITGGRLVVITGTDDEWSSALWEEFDVSRVRALAAAFGAAEVIDVHELAGRDAGHDAGREAGREAGRAAGHEAGRDAGRGSGIDPGVLRELEDATICRLNLVPRPGEADAGRAAARRERTRAFAAVYDSLFARLKPVALVTSHVDYDQWGLAVEAAMRREVPVIHVQSTGSLKAYALFPERRAGLRTFREELTQHLGELFERDVWPQREVIRRNAEMVAWRAKGNLGRPSWWRAGAATKFELRNETERRQLRELGMLRLGLDRARPVVVVFNHAVSDALGTNRELFGSLAEWFEETIEFAAAHDSASWILLDHPSQIRYDETGHFAALAGKYEGVAHLRFMPSIALSKNMLWSLTDVGVTVRGSVSNELPAFGIPVIQAGWSEWSHCGLSHVADSPAHYWRLLEQAIRTAAEGESYLDEQQRERARLWMWLYRSGADVSSPLFPHWESGAGPAYLNAMSVAMGHLEGDGDPLYSSLRRMWERREPLLCRFDLRDSGALADALAGTGRAR